MNKAKVITVDFSEKRSDRIKHKIEDAYHNAMDKAKNGVRWVVTHPEEAIIITSALGAVYGFGRKIYRDVKPSSTDKILKRQETMIYDPNCKVWWPIKHKMSTSQKLEFEHRRKFNGETVSEALRHMKLLKK